MKKILSICIISLFIFCSFNVQGSFFEKTSSKTTNTGLKDILFNLVVSLLMKKAHYPSLSACVINGDNVLWSKGYGYYDLTNNTPASETTIYNIASITKTITGTALMQLWEKGLFDLNEDVNNYLPFNLRNPHFPDVPITFRMLLTDTSSLDVDPLDYYRFNFSKDPPFEGYPYPWLEEHLVPGGRWYHPERWSPIYRPGEKYIYANANFDIVAYLVELISGESFIDYCDNYIFEPLEMYNTGFNLSELDIDKVAVPYWYEDGQYHEINQIVIWNVSLPSKYWRPFNYPVGGLYTTVSDLSHFMIAHMNGGVWNNVRILKENTVNSMHKSSLAWATIKPDKLDVTYSGYSGHNAGVNAHMYFIPSEKIGMIYLSNGFHPMDEVVNMIFLSLFIKGGFNIFSHIDFRNMGGAE